VSVSALSRRGSTRAWRRIRDAILIRDGHRCQMIRDGQRCGATATDVNHKVRRADAPRGFAVDAPSNLEAACPTCNRGVRIGRDLRPVHPTPAQLVIAQLLDRADVPYTAGRRKALPALIGAGHPWRNRDVDAACLWRRQRGPLIRV
jgi:hypothetical protein